MTFTTWRNTPTHVYQYYWNNITLLPKYEYFHFVTRLALVRGDARAHQEIKKLESMFEHQNVQTVWDTLQTYLTNVAPITFATSRQPYLDRYPQIRPWARSLFATRFAQTLFNLDVHAFLPSNLFTEGPDIVKTLLNDHQAIRELSAFATNFILMYEKYKNSSSEASMHLYEIGRSLYKPEHSAQELELWIYFLTHLIIGDSQFYTSTLRNTEFYKALLHEIEELITSNYLWVQLDCKVEFLVCCDICNYQTNLREVIGSEAHCSLSDSGNFIVDKYNLVPQKNRIDWVTSEHRNVLYLIAFYKQINHEAKLQINENLG